MIKISDMNWKNIRHSGWNNNNSHLFWQTHLVGCKRLRHTFGHDIFWSAPHDWTSRPFTVICHAMPTCCSHHPRQRHSALAASSYFSIFPYTTIQCFAGTANVNEEWVEKQIVISQSAHGLQGYTLHTEIEFACTIVRCSWRVQWILVNSLKNPLSTVKEEEEESSLETKI